MNAGRLPSVRRQASTAGALNLLRLLVSRLPIHGLPPDSRPPGQSLLLELLSSLVRWTRQLWLAIAADLRGLALKSNSIFAAGAARSGLEPVPELAVRVSLSHLPPLPHQDLHRTTLVSGSGPGSCPRVHALPMQEGQVHDGR